MPELPEVETIRDDLNKKILSKKIKDVVINKKKIIRNQSDDFIKIVKGNSFKKINRIGKLLIFELTGLEKFMFGAMKPFCAIIVL